MRLVLLTAMLCVGLAAAAAAQDAKAKGEKVFADQKCSLCKIPIGVALATDFMDDVVTERHRSEGSAGTRLHHLQGPEGLLNAELLTYPQSFLQHRGLEMEA